MSIESLYDLKEEITRLYVAGSRNAIGDLRLNKYIAMYNKLGEKSKIFKNLADQIEELVNSQEKESSQKLLKLSTLVYSILYTQGKYTNEDEKTEVPLSNWEFQETNVSYNTIEDYNFSMTDNKIIEDFRIYSKFEDLLNTKQYSLMNKVKEQVFPYMKDSLAIYFLNNFIINEDTGTLIKFEFIVSRLKKEVIPFAKKILDTDNKKLKQLAIETLGYDIVNEEQILSYSKENKSETLGAVLKALKLCNSNYFEKIYDEVIKRKKIDAIIKIGDLETNNKYGEKLIPFAKEEIEFIMSTVGKEHETTGVRREYTTKEKEAIKNIINATYIMSMFDSDEIFDFFTTLIFEFPYLVEDIRNNNIKLLYNFMKKSLRYNEVIQSFAKEYLIDEKKILYIFGKNNNYEIRYFLHEIFILFIQTSVNLYGYNNLYRNIKDVIKNNKNISKYSPIVIDENEISRILGKDTLIDGKLMYVDENNITSDKNVEFNSEIMCYFADFLTRGRINNITKYYNCKDVKFEKVMLNKIISLYNVEISSTYFTIFHDYEGILKLNNESAIEFLFKVVNNHLKDSKDQYVIRILQSNVHYLKQANVKTLFESLKNKDKYKNIINFYKKMEGEI